MSTHGWPSPSSATEIAGRLGESERRPGNGDRERSFPADGGVEYERSVIRIPFYLKGSAAARNKIDVMAFTAYMRLIREAPTTNALGFRQFEFFIEKWELANSRSDGLDADVTFTLSDTVQPKSICIAQQRDRDFPALIVYSAIYDVYLGSELIVEKQPGVAYATPVWSIPPRNVTVAFEKPLEHDLFAMSAGTCEGMQSISQEEFEQGFAQAQTIRGRG